jgi:hypothetical protein
VLDMQGATTDAELTFRLDHGGTNQ